MYNTPLYDELKRHAAQGFAPFYMPGHKRGQKMLPLFSLDVTELPTTDNLHMPQGVIKKAQELAAKAFGAKESFFLVNGSTCGIEAMILGCFEPGDKIIVARDCHQSLIYALILAGLEPVFVYPEFIGQLGIYGGIDLEKLKMAILENPEAKGVYITSPGYFGICQNIASIADIVHENNMLLLVDEAHGAAFAFSEQLPQTALSCGADLVVQSAHKTLPALTQSAYLHIGSHRIDKERISSALKLTQSSSPSYILMAYLDVARAFMQAHGKESIQSLLTFTKSIRKHNFFLDESYIGRYQIHDIDLSRLVLITKNAEDTLTRLKEKHKVEWEMATKSLGVFLPSVANTKEDFARLQGLVEEIPRKMPISVKEPERPETIIRPRDAFFSTKDLGDICKTIVAPYPPGIPVLIPGERRLINGERIILTKGCPSS